MIVGQRVKKTVSIHAPRGGSDFQSQGIITVLGMFQSTLPVGGATLIQALFYLTFTRFNPRSPWGERPPGQPPGPPLNEVSIHAPRGGSDLGLLFIVLQVALFQSTLPVGGATPIERLSW
jgi:hypothetical protein